MRFFKAKVYKDYGERLKIVFDKQLQSLKSMG